MIGSFSSSLHSMCVWQVCVCVCVCVWIPCLYVLIKKHFALLFSICKLGFITSIIGPLGSVSSVQSMSATKVSFLLLLA